MDNAYQFKTLLGHKNLAFSIACLYSLMRYSVDRIELQIFEDGTLTESDEDELRSCLNTVSVVR